jgi:PAS fold.
MQYILKTVPVSLKSYETALAAGTPFHHELRLRRFDGEYRWFENRGAQFATSPGVSRVGTVC